MPRKGDNIYKRRDGRWEGRYIKSRASNGQAQYGYVYAKSYREAKAKLVQAISNNANTLTQQPQSNGFESFGNLVTEWFMQKQSQIKESTSVKYRNLMTAYILPTLGNDRIDEITNERIESCCNNLLHTGGTRGFGFYHD